MNDLENINRLLKPIAYLNATLINVFIENWQGQKIIDSSERVFESAYDLYKITIVVARLQYHDAFLFMKT